MSKGFTLIELSIVLVIIGLITGGVLVGQDLIKAAELRATIAQIEKFNTAVNTFYGKYAALPGDLNGSVATTFGFTPRGQYAGEGDGNGILQGVSHDRAGSNVGQMTAAGETAMFWADLTYANGLNLNLIPGNFSAPSPTTGPATALTGAAIGTYLPSAKLGVGNYFYVYSVDNGCMGAAFTGYNNYYGMSAVNTIPDGVLSSTPALTVQQAYNIDRKIDDGLPQTGSVRPMYIDYNTFGGCGTGYANSQGTASSTSCFDTTSGKYSTSQTGNTGLNCALSFAIQGPP